MNRNREKKIFLFHLLHREAIKPDIIQERIVSAVIKHLGLEETVRYFTPSKESETDEFVLLTSVMEEICRRTDALIRQLQVSGNPLPCKYVNRHSLLLEILKLLCGKKKNYTFLKSHCFY